MGSALFVVSGKMRLSKTLETPASDYEWLGLVSNKFLPPEDGCVVCRDLSGAQYSNAGFDTDVKEKNEAKRAAHMQRIPGENPISGKHTRSFQARYHSTL